MGAPGLRAETWTEVHGAPTPAPCGGAVSSASGQRASIDPTAGGQTRRSGGTNPAVRSLFTSARVRGGANRRSAWA